MKRGFSQEIGAGSTGDDFHKTISPFLYPIKKMCPIVYRLSMLHDKIFLASSLFPKKNLTES
jgi:hypothetical protein